MTLPTLADFSQQARAQGFDEVVERVWPPETVLDTHTPPLRRLRAGGGR